MVKFRLLGNAIARAEAACYRYGNHARWPKALIARITRHRLKFYLNLTLSILTKIRVTFASTLPKNLA
jgi:hypothetical protein